MSQSKVANYSIVPGQEPVTVSIALNDHVLPEGSTPGRDQCGEIMFSTSASEPHCDFRNTAVLRCK